VFLAYASGPVLGPWYARTTLSMLALARLAVSKAQAVKGIGTGEPG
jgi:hypothetical protein